MGKRLLTALLTILFVFNSAFLFINAEADLENLVYGLSYTITTGEPVSFSHANFTIDGENLYEINNGQLTDGKKASPEEDFDIGEDHDIWYKAFGGKSRIITFDLGATASISSVTASFYHEKASGIYAPRYINISLSNDGENYQRVKEIPNAFPVYSNHNAVCVVDVGLDKKYAARYVAVEFNVDNLCYCDEISVFGSTTLTGKERKIRPDAAEKPKGYFKDLKGITDVVKMNNGESLLTEEQLLPYVAYLDTNGNIAGTMFPAMAFSPTDESLINSDVAGWEDYIQSTFADSYNLSALNKVVETTYSAMGINGKYNVFLTIPYPSVNDNAFGDINNDGKSEFSSTLEERYNIVKWYVDKCISQFKTANYSHLKLAGFYWGSDKIDYTQSDHESDLVKQVNKYVKNKGFFTVFDCQYLAPGFDQWESLGFSAAVMQPNAALDENSYFQLPMLGEFAYTAYNNYMGAVIEASSADKFNEDSYLDAGRNYESYLYYGYKQGYMYSFKSYGQSGGDLIYYQFCHSDITSNVGRYQRRLYDLTYAFLNKTYKNLAPVITADDIYLVFGDKSGLSDISITDSDSHWDDISVEFVSLPQNGSAAVAAGKQSLFYTPNEGFIGEDSFIIRAFDGFNYSAEITVKVIVSKPDESFSFTIDDKSSEAASSNDEVNEKSSLALWIVISLIILAVISAAAIIYFKGKNKDN